MKIFNGFTLTEQVNNILKDAENPYDDLLVIAHLETVKDLKGSYYFYEDATTIYSQGDATFEDMLEDAEYLNNTLECAIKIPTNQNDEEAELGRYICNILDEVFAEKLYDLVYQ